MVDRWMDGWIDGCMDGQIERQKTGKRQTKCVQLRMERHKWVVSFEGLKLEGHR